MKITLSIAFFCVIILKSYAQHSDTSKVKLFTASPDELLKIPVKEVQEVSIASNVVKDISKQPASVTVITKEQIRLSGARTLSEALTLFAPGYFAIEDQDDLIAGFRGLAPDNNSKVLMLINGQNLNTEFFWGPPDAVLNSSNLEYIERIEVIRGPGSVTLGQGALLGVINIVTKDAKDAENGAFEVSTSAGLNDFYNGSIGVKINTKGIRSYTYISGLSYHGQALRNEGWAAQQGNQGFAGGKVADMGHRLRRSQNTTIINTTQINDLVINLLKAGQRRDLYNFYRDREVIRQDLLSLTLGYNFKISEKVSNVSSVSFINDDYGLYSLTGTTMGGTAEQRYGAKSVFNLDGLWKNNKTAIGIEYRIFSMGLPNRAGNNYIANVVGSFDPATANQDLTMSYRENITLLSIFGENYFSPTEKLDLFAAFRYDQHPFWGQNISPRLGVIFSPNKNFSVRASYQAGFRGAVGLHYSGGYRRDGFLRAENYTLVDAAGIPNARNIDLIAPERINNIELAFRWNILSSLTLNTVVFYNIVQNVIDVGVFYQNPDDFNMVNIGSDIPGDWNGYWFFKNTPGTFSQIGNETVLNFNHEKVSITLSNALVKVMEATEEQKDLAINANSMYLAADENKKLRYKAFPENVTRLSIIAKPVSKFYAGVHSMYYSKWYSPAGTVAQGGFILNAGVGYDFSEKFSLDLQAKNLTNNTNLYPMNSNAGGPDVSPGTPAWETTTFWATLRLKW
ncbi:TonB-dependent receptor plug domain-containing protein [Raineya orbicola]|uniref:TonB-dependent Receptor Plug Domain n=1 Tax=Raineya orbicola TaxID=2016530 RepID=A0A2N3IAS1_9BACT|nr:TonB-dependent receptor [Raineya orbicola]PKQ67431.1 TonB-dependent Receptor Plug Domain [Raineya orbicola]